MYMIYRELKPKTIFGMKGPEKIIPIPMWRVLILKKLKVLIMSLIKFMLMILIMKEFSTLNDRPRLSNLFMLLETIMIIKSMKLTAR